MIRIDLPFLEDLRSNWVVIIGLDLISLACPGMGLGSCYVSSSFLCHPPDVIMVILILLVWRIGFGVTGMELVGAI